MKIGLLTSALSRNLGYAEVIDWAGANGFESLEVDIGVSAFPDRHMLLNVSELLSGGKAALDAATEPLKRNDISIGSFFFYGLNNLHPDLEVRTKVLGGLRDSIRAAALMGVPVIVTAAGSPVPYRPDRSRLNPWGIYYLGSVNAEGRRIRQEGYQIFAETYLPIADFAQANGVKIAFEPSAVGGGAGAVAHSPETFDELFKVADHPCLGMNFDPSHWLWQEIDYLSYAARLAREGKIFSCHGKDNEILSERIAYSGILGDGWWRHRIPGFGQVKWAELIHALQQNGYDRVINVEHEDPLFGFQFDAEGKIVDIELAKQAFLSGLAYLKVSRTTAGK